MRNIKKLAHLVTAATLQFTRLYQKQAVDWAKVEAAACYVKGVQAVRRQCLFVALQFFALFLLAAAAVMFPLGIVMLLPCALKTKLFLLASLGVIYAGAPLFVLSQLFSEKRWLAFTKSSLIVEKVTRKN